MIFLNNFINSFYKICNSYGIIPRYYIPRLSVIPNQYSHQIINENENPPVAGQASLIGKLRKKLPGQKLETVEPCLNAVQRTQGF